MATNSGGAEDFCCEMRRYFPMVLMASPENLPQPKNILDFVLYTDAGATVFTRFCPFCGKEIGQGQARRTTTFEGGGPPPQDA